MYTPGLPDVTITVLDITLRLCTIPRLRLPEATHYVVKQFLRQRPTFLNITLNTSELSIFAEDTTLDDFRPLAHRGRFRGPGAPVEISPDTWSVLQIDEDKFGRSPLSMGIPLIELRRRWDPRVRNIRCPCPRRNIDSLPVELHERLYSGM